MGRGSVLVVMVLFAGQTLAAKGVAGEPQAAIPDSRIGTRIAPLLLLSRPDVQADLGMNRTQADEAAQAIRALIARAAEIRGLQGEKLLEARRAVDGEQLQWIQNHLSETQQKRIVQIDLQWEGPAALVSRPKLSEMVDLTAEQRVTLRKAVDAARQRRAGGEDVVAVESKLTQEALRVLTETQRARWKEILGRPYQPRLASTKPARP